VSRFEVFVSAWALVGGLVVVYLASGTVSDVIVAVVSRRRSRVLAALGLVLFESDREAEANFERVLDLPKRALLGVLQTLAVDLNGAAHLRLRRVVRATGLERSIRRRARSRRWRVRVQAAQLHHLVDHPDFDRERLLADRHSIVRARTAESMTPEQATHHVATLLAMLGDPDPGVRMAAQQAVLNAGVAAVPMLMDRLSAPPGSTEPMAALEIAANLGDPRLVPLLGAHAGSDSARARRMVAKALGNATGGESADLLVQMLGDGDEEVRAIAADSLARIDAVATVNRLGGLLRDESFGVRRSAGLSLDRLGAPGRLVLRRLLEDEDRFARDMARQVLDSAGARLGMSLVPAPTDVLAELGEADPYAAIASTSVDPTRYSERDIRETVRGEANRALAQIAEGADWPTAGPITDRERSAAMFVAISATDLIDALLGTAEAVR
jgi:HEAT repeat protein